MQREPEGSSRTLYTVGHSNHQLEDFFQLLRRFAIRLVVDVRSSPYARYAVQYNREILESHLRAEGFSYLFLGHVLGGRPDDARFYDAEGYVLYDRLAQWPPFQEALADVLARAARFRTVLLCGEEDPSECHRRRLIGRVAGSRGFQVVHLRGDGRAESESELAGAEAFQKTKGQLSLFDTEEEAPWRSTQSVSRGNRPGSSSRACEGSE
ncbi:MAG: DUF488 family protein [Thermoguttaceae bacterium]